MIPTSSLASVGAAALPAAAPVAGTDPVAVAFEVRRPAPAAAAPAAGAPVAGAPPTALDAIASPFTQLEEVSRRVRELLAHWREQESSLLAQLGEGYREQPAYMAAARRHQEELFALQLDVQQAAFRFELASKMVEHATGGARTVLQTQA